jgi:protoheme IX farnesyltransferase
MSEFVDIQSESTDAAAIARPRWLNYVELSKPRIAVLVLVATGVGFCLAPAQVTGLAFVGRLLATLVGTALVAAAANAINQLIEVEYDAMMVRTRRRPLPSGRLGGSEVLLFGVSSAVMGVALLALAAGPLAAACAAFTFVSYVAVYTPLKRVTTYSVLVGAIPGAMPPVIGWTAAGGALGIECLLLFVIVFFWQLPHFLAIAWLYREDYGRAGYPVLPVVDRDGTRTDFEMVTHSVALLFASLLPAIYGQAGALYAMGAILLGLGFLACGIAFICRKTTLMARWHVLASVVYLPLLLGFMILDKLRS